MSQNNIENCPDTTTLADYLLGQLEPPTLDECESHIADCDTCHETLRGLSTGDTLSEHVANAFLQATESDSFSVDSDQNNHVSGLVNRILSQTNSRSVAPRPSSVDAEVLADRAAEVLRCVDPDPNHQTLGTIGDYQLIRLIGAGSTGVVFQAIDQKLDRTVALKVLRPSLGSVARERFIAEARLAASIEHPNVVTIYQIDQYDRLAFIAMQWLPGQTLEAKLHSTATMADQDVRRISAQVAAGLQAAHQRQLVHRDIKPANVWISDDDEVKILDFGLARIVDDDPGLTATGMLAGTPNFMSPEQTKGHELDGRSDLFSLGCMMYRMATGKLAFGATSILGTLQAIQHEQPTPPKLVNVDISEDLSDLTMALLEKQPANRPESAAQVVTMLEAARDQWPMKIAGYESPQPASVDKPNSQSKRQRSGGRWVAFIAASLLGFAGWYLSPQIIRIATDQGELVIESEDKDVEVQILQDGQVVHVLDTKTKNSFNIESGEYQIKAVGDGNSFEVTPEVLTMKRGHQTVVSVTKQPSPHESNAPTVAKLRAKGFNQAQAIALEKLARSGKYKEGMTFAIGENGEGFNTGTPLINTAPKRIKDDVVRDAPSPEPPTTASNRRSEPTFRTSDLFNPKPEEYRNEFKKLEGRTNLAKHRIAQWQEEFIQLRELPKGQVNSSGVPISDVMEELNIRTGTQEEESLRDKQFLERRFWSHFRIINREYLFAKMAFDTANKTKTRSQALLKKGSISFADWELAELETDRAKLQLANILEQLKIYQSVAKEFSLKHDQSSADLKSTLVSAVELRNQKDTESKFSADRDKRTRPRAFNAEQQIVFEKLKLSGILKDGMSGTIVLDGKGLTINSPSIHTDPKKINDGILPDTSLMRVYPVTTDTQLALDRLQIVLKDRDAVKISLDAKKGLIAVVGRKNDHQLVSEALAKLEKDRALRKKRIASQPLYKGKPFVHWFKITKTERSAEMLCDALKAGAELAETAVEKAALLEVTRTLARKHGTGVSGRKDQYHQALSKAINVLAPAEIFQFILDELEHGTPQSVSFCSTLFRNMSIGNRGPINWSEAHGNTFVARAPELLQLSVAKIEGGDAGYSVLRSVVATLIETRRSVASFAGGGKRAYVSGVLEKRVSWANEKNPTLAPTIRQLFLDSSAATKLGLVQLTRAFYPNDEEVELALQSSLFDPSTNVQIRNSLYWMIVGKNNRDTYQDFLESSPKPIAVQFLKNLLDNQLGPENQRIVVMDDWREDIEGRTATISHIYWSAKSLMQKHPNDTDEDVSAAFRELFERIVEIENTNNPKLKRELDDFKALGVFEEAKTLLEEIAK